MGKGQTYANFANLKNVHGGGGGGYVLIKFNVIFKLTGLFLTCYITLQNMRGSFFVTQFSICLFNVGSYSSDVITDSSVYSLLSICNYQY